MRVSFIKPVKPPKVSRVKEKDMENVPFTKNRHNLGSKQNKFRGKIQQFHFDEDLSPRSKEKPQSKHNSAFLNTRMLQDKSRSEGDSAYTSSMAKRYPVHINAKLLAMDLK
mmetsp:Transcript_36066/g.41650  ORF Transcript_36066/g.41650 Transcript_36066/m.41650 type:complete len:111 (-) Transcript_36066:229-561(-)